MCFFDVLKAANYYISEEDFEAYVAAQGAFALCRYPEEKKRPNAVIWLSPRVKVGSINGIGTLCHEALHASVGILRYAGVKIVQESEEALAYHQTWLVEQSLRRLRGARRA